jgi:D-3-phosphoglycerate dehydrogenase
MESIRIKNASIVIKTAIAPLEELLAESDFITVHVPYNKESGTFLKKEHFSQMKKGVFFINASRGGVVDEDAMLEALNNGTISFAGIDVFDNEPLPRQDILAHPKVSVTPHIGASTTEAQERVWQEMATTLISFFQPS